MGFLNNFLITRQAQKVSDLAAEEEIYAQVKNEVESNNISEGLWAKAASSASSSDYEDVKREYIRLRAERLHEERKLYSQILKETQEIAENGLQQRRVEEKLKLHFDERPTVSQILESKSENPLINTVKDEIKTGAVHRKLWDRAEEEVESTDQVEIIKAYIVLRTAYLETQRK